MQASSDKSFELEEIRKRDPRAMEALVRAYSDQLYRAALGANLSETDARDVVQDVFLTFLQTLDRFEGRSKLRTWLFGILFNKIREMRRKIGKRNREDELDDIIESRFNERGHWVRPPRDPESLLGSQEILSAFQSCLKDLSDNHRQAFELREIQGFSTEEICKILDVSITNLGVILYRARNRLRECLEKKGFEGSKTNA